MTSFLHAYFTRLHCQPLGVPTVEALRTLHLAHNCAIPFENLDVLLPREIQLDETALEEKLLYARRGGYCFELNGLFERALRDKIIQKAKAGCPVSQVLNAEITLDYQLNA